MNKPGCLFYKAFVLALCLCFLGCATAQVKPPENCEDSFFYNKMPWFVANGQYVLEAGIVSLVALEPQVKQPLTEALELAREAMLQGNVMQGLGYVSMALTKYIKDEKLKAVAVSTLVVLSQAEFAVNQNLVINPCDRDFLVNIVDRLLDKFKQFPGE